MPTNDKIIVREVGLRDGIQNIAEVIPTAVKLAWLKAEHDAGVTSFEVCSFVPPKLLPQFSDASDMAGSALQLPGVFASALVPNLIGADRGIDLGIHQLNFVMSVSASHNQANVRRSREESLAEFGRISKRISQLDPSRRPRLSGGLATCFGCTLEGAIAETDVLYFAEALVEQGADEIIIADTVGYATPGTVKSLFRKVQAALDPIPVVAHFHDTRGQGIANALAAFETGVRHFDACLGGLGGCPYAPGASGNIVMEDLVFMLEGMDVKTGFDLDRLIDVRRILLEALPGVQLHGQLAKSGLPKGHSRGFAQPIPVTAGLGR